MGEIENCQSICGAWGADIAARSAGYCELCGYPPPAADALELHAFAEPVSAAGDAAAVCGPCHRTVHVDTAADGQAQARAAAVERARAAGRFIIVAAAIVKDPEGRILVASRRYSQELGLRWEFPGGKLERGETLEECLLREMEEELSSALGPPRRFFMTDYRYERYDIRLCALEAPMGAGELRANEHCDVRWVVPEEILSLALAPADVAIARALLRGA